MNIEIVTTVNNPLKEIGFGYYSSYIDVLKAVKHSGNTSRLTVCESIDDLDAMAARKPDFVFLVAKYLSIKNSKNILFSDYLSKKKIAFSDSEHDTLRYISGNETLKSCSPHWPKASVIKGYDGKSWN